MSPEQCRGDPLDRRTDIFSLGIVFHELVTGRRLFERSGELMILKAITEDPIPEPCELRPDLPQPINRVILRALRRHPDQRYTDAAMMGQAVREALVGTGVESSQHELARLLQSEFADLLDARAEALQRVIKLRPSTEAPPVVDGFQDSSLSVPPVEVEGPPRARRNTLRVKTARPGFPLRRALVIGLAVVVAAGLAGLLYRHLRGGGSRPSGPSLRYGLPPSFPARVAREELKPFLRYLERRLQRRVELVVPGSYRELRRLLLDGRLDFANLPALQLVLARDEDPGLEVVATQTYEQARRYQSYIIVRDDSPISGPEELQGKRFCYVDPESTSGYLLPRHFFIRTGVNPDRLFGSTRFSGNHVKVMRDVIAGRCDAGAVYSGALLSAHSLGVPSSRLRMLLITGQVPYDVICASPKLPAELRRRLRDALLQMDAQRHLGRKVVGPTFRIDGFVEPRLEEFREIEVAARAAGMLKRPATP
jgi:phosphate/phosphite/phosphonate ABC transporter binding protein